MSNQIDAIESAQVEIVKAISVSKAMFDDYLALRCLLPAGYYDEDIEVLFSVQIDILCNARAVLDTATRQATRAGA